jgi:hypothetical protein
MSVQPPPQNPNSPAYNNQNFIGSSSTTITPQYLQANYLQFPTAQGTEEFPNGVITSDLLTFNSATGSEREINGVSLISMKDVNGNTTYTSFIEESSIPIGAYDGGLIINSSNTINLVGSNVLVNGVPVDAGGGGGDTYQAGNNNFTGNNTFSGTNIFNTNTTTFNSDILSNNISIDGNLTFPTNNSQIVLNDTLQFQNTNSPTYPLLLNNTSSDEWSLLYSNPVNFNLNFPNKTIDIIAQNINLTASSSVSVSSILISPNSPTITINNLSNSNGTFYPNGGLPYFSYNNAGSITSSPLVVSSTLNNYSTLAGGTALVPQTFIGYNQFNNIVNISSNLIFPNSSSQIVLNNTLGFQNSNATSYPIQLRNDNLSPIEWYLEPTTNPVNFNLNFGGMSINASATFISLNASSAVQVGNILTNPNNPTINTTALGSGRGTFYSNSQAPYFAYNNGGVITSYPLVISSALGNYALTTGGGNSFTNINTFSQIPTISASTPSANDNSTKVATTAFVQSAIQYSAPPSVIIINTPNNTIVNGNLVTWTFTTSAFLGNNFTFTGLSLLSSLNQVPTNTFTSSPLTPSGTSIAISGNGIRQPFVVFPSLTNYYGYCFSVINSIGVATIALQSLITNSTGNINYILQISFPSGSSALQAFIDNPCPFRFYIQPINLFY